MICMCIYLVHTFDPCPYDLLLSHATPGNSHSVHASAYHSVLCYPNIGGDDVPSSHVSCAEEEEDNLIMSVDDDYVNQEPGLSFQDWNALKKVRKVSFIIC